MTQVSRPRAVMHRMRMSAQYPPSAMTRILPLLVFSIVLTGCDQLGIESPAAAAARQEADGKAIGGACRHSGRALEDCYEMNKRASKAAVYAGWRDMDAYMRENKIDIVPPAPEPSDKVGEKAGAEAAAEKRVPASEPAPAKDKAGSEKPAAKKT